MTPNQVRQKFVENAELVLTANQVDRVVNNVQSLDMITDVTTIVTDCIAA